MGARFLLGESGGLLCQVDGALRMVAFSQAGGAALTLAPVTADAVDGHAMGLSTIWPLPAGDGALAGYRLHPGPMPFTVRLERDGASLASTRPGALAGAEEDAGFLLLAQADRTILTGLLGSVWLGEDGDLAQGTLEAGFRLRIGALRFDLRHVLPFEGGGLPFRLRLLAEGWRIATLRLYRPLIYFTAFRSPAVLGQLILALRSLVEIAGYDGHICVLTDQPRERLLASLPSIRPERLLVRTLSPADRVGFVASRYAILDSVEALRFQPVMFMDSDIIFNADLTPMLKAVARSERIAAPIERFSRLGEAISAGAELLAEDRVETYHALGFNAGTLGIPNLLEHRQTLALIRRIILNRSDRLGRRHFGFVDQPIANYAAFRLESVDTALISPYVRWGFSGREDGRKTGLVHFWPPRSAAKKEAMMREYFDALKEGG